MSHLPPGIPSNLGEIEAAFLVGAMTCFALYGITCAQTVYYYRTYIGDHIFRKALVATLWFLETAHLILIGNTCYDLYVYSKMPEKQAGLFLVAKPFAVSFALTVLMTSMVQSFYAWRVWAVSQSSKIKGLGTAAVSFILFASFVQFALGITSDVFLFVRPALPEIHSPRIEGLYSAQLAISMAGDVVISLSLVYFLNQSRSGFRATENIIDRLIIYSVNVGIVTSAISVVTFVVFHALPTKTHFTAFTEIISKLYVNSLLVTLNSRKSIRKVYDVKPSAESYAMVGSTGMGVSHVSHTKLGTVGMGSTVGKSAFNPGYSQAEPSWYPSSKA